MNIAQVPYKLFRRMCVTSTVPQYTVVYSL